MQYLKFQLIKKHTPFHIPPGCLLPPASMQSDSSSHRLCLICFSEIKIERSRNIYLFAGAFCFTTKLQLMTSSVDLKNGTVLAFLRIDWYIARVCGSKQNILHEEGENMAKLLQQNVGSSQGWIWKPDWGSTLNTPMMLHTNREMEQINLVFRNALHTSWCCMISNLSANELQPLVMVSAPRGRPVSQKSCWLRGKCNTGVKQTW